MTSMVCVGAQWGDEGKGKVVDTIAENANMVVRYNGGNNAGHTLVINGKKIVLHIVPTGAMWDHTVNVIGNGVLVDPIVLAEEIKLLQSLGKLKDKRALIISPFCHVITHEHVETDNNRENNNGNRLGTTRRGVGPCYEDKVARTGMRIANLLKTDFSSTRPDHWWAKLGEARDIIAPFVRDPAKQISHFCRDKDLVVLFEGAQGTMLDIDYGTYPYVTSSHTVAAYAPVGAGVSHRIVGDVVGITKAYTTRVGPGPFPTAMDDATDNHVRSKGGEFGATTGRPRKCGWLDLVALKRAVKADQIKHLAVTKVDVLEKMDEIKVCTTYTLDGKVMSRMPYTAEEWNKVVPHYAKFAGFDQVLDQKTATPKWEDLHTNARTFLKFIANYLNVEICLVGIGPARSEAILRYNPLKE